MIISKEDFWQEVRLLALNNYGNWQTKEEASSIIHQAINDVIQNLKDEIMGLKTYTHFKTELLNDMLEMNEIKA